MKVFILGSAGIPARYGGFEVFAENISAYLAKEFEVSVACSKLLYSANERITQTNNPKRFFIPLKPNGIQSIWYDFYSLLLACIYSDFIIMLGVGSGFTLSLFKILFNKPIAVHLDGLEWKREKWGYFTKYFLKLNASLCCRFADYIIIDNKSLLSFIPARFVPKAIHISYGCDHLPANMLLESIPLRPFALTIARAEPENNIQMIIDTFKTIVNLDLVIISNWKDTSYGRSIIKKNSECPNIKLIGPIYNDLKIIHQYRLSCKVYIHGHTAGGTNPSLVEAMAAGKPVLAHDNSFNRSTTDNNAFYFENSAELITHLNNLDSDIYRQSGNKLKEFAIQMYKWEEVSKKLTDMIRNRNVNNQ